MHRAIQAVSFARFVGEMYCCCKNKSFPALPAFLLVCVAFFVPMSIIVIYLYVTIAVWAFCIAHIILSLPNTYFNSDWPSASRLSGLFVLLYSGCLRTLLAFGFKNVSERFSSYADH